MLAVPAACLLVGRANAQLRRVEVPFQLRRNQPLARLTINQRGPYWFLLDTGAGGFVIDAALAIELGLRGVAEGTSQGAVGRTRVVFVEADEVFVEGGLRERDVYMGAIPLGPAEYRGLFPMALNAPEIGFDFTRSRFIVDTRPPDTHEGFERVQISMETPTRVRNARAGTDPSPRADVQVDGRPASLILDTGANGAVFLNPDYVRRHGLWDRTERFRPGIAIGVAGAFRTRTVLLDSLQLGRYRFENIPAELGDPDDANRDGWGEHDGLLGVEVLRRLDFFLKPRRDEMWLRANEHLGDIYRFDRSGMTVDWRDERVTVTSVAEGGPASRAGILAGDVVVAAPAGTVSGLEWLLTETAGTEVPMRVSTGGGAPRDVTVTLDDGFGD